MNTNLNQRTTNTEVISFEEKDIKDLILNKWDISFDINGEVLINIMNYITEISTDVPMKFYKYGIFINAVSMDNVQYAEIDISAGDLLNYDAGFIIEDISASFDKEDDKKDDKEGSNAIQEPILIVVDMKDTIGELESSIEKDQLVSVRIDYTWNKKIEFHCPDGLIYWSRLVAPDEKILKLEGIRDMIKKVRAKSDVTKSTILMEPSAFNKLCKIGSKASKKRDSDRITSIRVTKNCMFAASGDKIKGRILNLDYSEGFVTQSTANVAGFDNSSSVDNEAQNEIPVIDMANDEAYDMINMDSQQNVVDDKKSESSVSTISSNQLLGMEVVDKETVIVSNDYIEPFIKLKGLSPITLEIRTNKPIVVMQKPYNGINALLSVAPRIDKD